MTPDSGFLTWFRPASLPTIEIIHESDWYGVCKTLGQMPVSQENYSDSRRIDGRNVNMQSTIDMLTRLASAQTPGEAEAALMLARLHGEFEAYRPLIETLAGRVDEIFRLKRLAGSDELTGIANRRTFRTALDRECARHDRNQAGLGVILLDLDDLKQINDTEGHCMGDSAIITAAHAIQESLRATDVAARIGGDEFAVLLPGAHLADTKRVAERIRAAVESQLIAAKPLRVSIGYAAREEGPAHAASLILKADAKLYANKRARKRAASAAA